MVRYGDGWSLDLWICHATEENVGQKAKQGNKKINRPKDQETTQNDGQSHVPSFGRSISKKKPNKLVNNAKTGRNRWPKWAQRGRGGEPRIVGGIVGKWGQNDIGFLRNSLANI